MRHKAKPLGLACIVCGMAIVVVGTGAVSSVTSPHSTSVTVADNSSAYLGISLTQAADPAIDQDTVAVTQPTATPNGTKAVSPQTPRSGVKTVTLGTVTNRFSGELSSFEVTVVNPVAGGPTVHNVSVQSEVLAPGSSSPLIANVECGTAQSPKTVTLRIEATGSTIHVSTMRTVKITCSGPPANATRTQGAA